MRRKYDIPEIRTLIQSFDSARFHDDRDIDRMYDTAQARTEALIAVLFGRTIVVPAGVVADCPSFMTIFTEMMHGMSQVREKFYDFSTYRPFSLGLEKQFGNYDDFVADYIETEADLVVLDGIASRRDAARGALIKELSRAYLERDFDKLHAAQQGYGFYASLICEEFGRDSQSGTLATHANESRFVTSQPDGFAYYLKTMLEKLWNKGIELDVLAELDEGVAAAFSDIENPSLRGAWYAARGRFNNSWNIARIWLDHALYREFTTRYDVHIPSYFLQELRMEEYPIEIPLAFVGDSVVDAMKEREQRDEPGVTAASEKVAWSKVWEVVSDEKFQTSVKSLNGQLVRALKDENRDLKEAQEIGSEDPIKAERLAREARQDRQARISDALDLHIDNINGCLDDYRVTNTGSRIAVSFKKSIRKVFESKLMAVVASSATTAAVTGTVTHLLSGSGIAESALNSTAQNAFAGATASAFVVSAAYTIDRVLRPEPDWFGIKKSEIDKHKDKMNYWLGAEKYG